jgi:mRNA interferase RelE/StbE
MPWRLRITPRAEKDLASMPRRDREALRRAILRVPDEFGAMDVTKLAGRGNRWRLRVGRWRVIFDVDNTTGTMLVTRVLARKDAYRD